MESRGFARLLKRYLEDRLSKSERTSIEAWLNEDKTGSHERFIWRKEDEDLLYREITARIERDGRGKGGSGIGYWLKVAATVLVLSGLYAMSQLLHDTLTMDQKVADREANRESPPESRK